jgi:uncharacterized protein (DUF302 family)
MSEDGLVTVASKYSVKETLDKLEAELKTKNIKLFARIDHAAGAASVSASLRPTEVLIFGNARSGTPLMQSRQTVGIDLPLKILGWQDEAGKVWLTYIDPHWLARRHHLDPAAEGSVAVLAAVLANLVSVASI